MLSSVLPAGRHALSITAEYRRLPSEGFEDLGCPNQSPDLSPCGAIELNKFRVMEASKLCTCVAGMLMLIWVAYEVMWSEDELCPCRKFGVLPVNGYNNVSNCFWVKVHINQHKRHHVALDWSRVCACARKCLHLCMWTCVCMCLFVCGYVCVCVCLSVCVSMHVALQHRCPSLPFDCKRLSEQTLLWIGHIQHISLIILSLPWAQCSHHSLLTHSINPLQIYSHVSLSTECPSERYKFRRGPSESFVSDQSSLLRSQ